MYAFRSRTVSDGKKTHQRARTHGGRFRARVEWRPRTSEAETTLQRAFDRRRVRGAGRFYFSVCSLLLLIVIILRIRMVRSRFYILERKSFCPTRHIFHCKLYDITAVTVYFWKKSIYRCYS